MAPVRYKPTPYDTKVEGPSLTETEHQDSCDINKMLHNASRGLQVRGNSHPQTYGYDDTTMDGVQFRIQKENLEQNLANGQKEFEQNELDLIPTQVQKKFGFKVRKKQTPTNDDKTTKKGDPTPDPQETPNVQPGQS